jgi:hypothetical protein
MNDHVIQKIVPTFVIRGHCFAHKTNLVVITFLDVPLEHQLESVLQIFYAFLFTTQRNMQNFKSLLIFSIQNATSYWKMWKPIGFPECQWYKCVNLKLFVIIHGISLCNAYYNEWNVFEEFVDHDFLENCEMASQ